MAAKKNLKLIVAIVMLAFFMLAAVVTFILRGKVDEDFLATTTDSGSFVEFRGQLDGWTGYGPLASDRLQNRLRADGIRLIWESDGGLYDQRVANLMSGSIDMAVITVDAHQLNRVRDQFAGVAVMVIDESHGGDATLVHNECGIASISDLSVMPAYSTGSPDGWKATYISHSPSHHQNRTIGKDYGIDALLAQDKQWYVEPTSDRHAFELFRDKKVCVATLWEPYVTKAEALEGVSEIYSSRQVNKGIVDVLIVRNDILAPRHPKHEKLKVLMSRYFDVLQELKSDSDLMVSEMRGFLKEYADLNASDEEIQSMVDGVKWINLRDNAELWFGLGGEKYFGLTEAHEFAADIIAADEAHAGHLRGFDFSQVIGSALMRDLYLDGGYQGKSEGTTVTDSLTELFTSLSRENWNQLQDVGTLSARRIVFMRGETELSSELTSRIAGVMEELRRYPYFRIELLSAAEKSLAEKRTQVIVDHLVNQYKIDPDRLLVTILEGDEVTSRLAQKHGESDRSYESRIREIHFNMKTVQR